MAKPCYESLRDIISEPLHEPAGDFQQTREFTIQGAVQVWQEEAQRYDLGKQLLSHVLGRLGCAAQAEDALIAGPNEELFKFSLFIKP